MILIFFTIHVVLTVNFSSEIYEASESDGLVHVCLLKDRDSDEDVLIHVNASELDIAEAVGMTFNCS